MRVFGVRTAWLIAGLACASLTVEGAGTARAQESGRLIATAGATEIDGAGGGGLAPWALITGYETRDAIGANLHDSYVRSGDFWLDGVGIGVGLYDRLELSYTHVIFDTGQAGARLGLGRGYQFNLDTEGVKLRLLGRAVYDQDTWLPQLAIGAQFKQAGSPGVLRAVGAKASAGADIYVAATKIFLAESLLVDVTVTATRANQFGILGFGGDGGSAYHAEPSGSIAYLVSRRFAIGAEYRAKPNNLRFAKETDAYDAFTSFFLTKNISFTLAYVNLGPIARQGTQNAVYLSTQLGF